MKKRFSRAALPASLAACLLLSGCSTPVIGTGVKDAADIVEKYAGLMGESCNYHVDMDMDFGISADAQGISVELPVTMGLSMDVLDGNLHGDVDLLMTFMGQAVKDSVEVYMESGKRKVTVYTYDPEDGYWSVSEDDGGAGIALGFTDLDAADFRDASMEHDKKDGTYTITQSFGDFAGSGSAYDMLEGVYGGMAEMVGMDADDFVDEWEDAEVVYVFDRDFYLESVTLEDCKYSGMVEQDGVSLDVDVSLGLSFEFSDYGRIKGSDVEVPDDVMENAVPSVTLGSADVNMDAGMGGTQAPGLVEVPMETDPGFAINPGTQEIDPGFSVDPGTLDPGVQDIDPGFSVKPQASGSLLGSYGGIVFTAMGDDWDSTFGADGWEFANDDGEYGFMTAENPKYGDADLYVYNRNMDGATRSDIINYGIYGYDIDCTWASAYPDMEWGGLTFGAAADQVFAVYGEPYFVYEGSLYTAYTYKSGEDIEIEFYVYPDGGLKRVNVSYYGGI